MALSLYSLVSSPPDKDRVFGNDVFVWINSLAPWALPLYFVAQNTGGEGEMYILFASAPMLFKIPRHACRVR